MACCPICQKPGYRTISDLRTHLSLMHDDKTGRGFLKVLEVLDAISEFGLERARKGMP